MSRRGNINKLYDLASAQWGIFTSTQAVDLGVSRNQLTRMANDGRIEHIAYGTYRITAGEETENTVVKATWLSLYPKKTAFERLSTFPYDAVATGRTAACLQGYGDFYESPYCFIVAQNKRTTRKELEFLHESIEARDVDLTFGIPSTTPNRTLADLLKLEEEPSLIDDYVEQASSSGYIFDEKRLAALLEPICNSHGYQNGAEYVKSLLGRSAIPAALASALDQVNKVLESSSSLQDLAKTLNTITQPMPDGFETALTAAVETLQAVHIPPETYATMRNLSEQLKTISSLINQGVPRQALSATTISDMVNTSSKSAHSDDTSET